MAASFSDPGARRQARSNDDAVSEVIGFLLTFAIISFILLVSMLAFNSAQARAENRLIEIQGASAAQRVAAAAVDLALFATDHPYNTSIAIDLPVELQGISYSVFLCQDGAVCGDGSNWCATNACPYVKTVSFRGDPQYQSTFLLAGQTFCHSLGPKNAFIDANFNDIRDGQGGEPAIAAEFNGGRNSAGGGSVLVRYFADDLRIDEADVDTDLPGYQRLDKCIGLEDAENET